MATHSHYCCANSTSGWFHGRQISCLSPCGSCPAVGGIQLRYGRWPVGQRLLLLVSVTDLMKWTIPSTCCGKILWVLFRQQLQVIRNMSSWKGEWSCCGWHTSGLLQTWWHSCAIVPWQLTLSVRLIFDSPNSFSIQRFLYFFNFFLFKKSIVIYKVTHHRVLDRQCFSTSPTASINVPPSMTL